MDPKAKVGDFIVFNPSTEHIENYEANVTEARQAAANYGNYGVTYIFRVVEVHGKPYPES